MSIAEADTLAAKKDTVTIPPAETPPLDEIERMIRAAGELLPTVGPITAFVFLNTLQGLEHLPFDEGLKQGERLFGCNPYLPESEYRAHFEQGRITRADLCAAIRTDLMGRGEAKINDLTNRYELRLAMLEYPLRVGPAEELRWFVAETDALTKIRTEAPPQIAEKLLEETRHWVMRDLMGRHWSEMTSLGSAPPRYDFADLLRHFDSKNIERWSRSTWETFTLQALWRVCRHEVQTLPPAEAPPSHLIRHRDFLQEAVGEDSDALVHELLIRYCAAFCDQGFAGWDLPYRELGFYKAFLAVYGRKYGPPDDWLEGLPHELRRLEAANIGPLESIAESLRMLGVPRHEWQDYLTASLLSLRGWAGLLLHMEVRADRVPLPVSPGTQFEFIAVKLILDRLALAYVAQVEMDYTGPLDQLREAALLRVVSPPNGIEQRAFLVFQIAQVLGWSPERLLRLTSNDWATLISEIEAFNRFERRRILHQAFEGNYRTNALNAISIHTNRPSERVKQPKYQAVFCIDTREESFRRHFEEVEPQVETFGAAGFYGVPIYYKGAADAYYSTLCPIVVMPKHWVVEEVVYSLNEEHKRRAKTRRVIGSAQQQVHLRSRSIASGALLTASLGVLASIPLVARVLFPRLTARIRKTAGRFVEAPPITRLRLERTAPDPSPEDDGIGFSLAEMANIGERMLRDIGLTSNFARLVMFFGHGSYCLNNPHKSAYDCGACSGGMGGPNARALAMILNDPRVRKTLLERGIDVPETTRFIGGLHNTCNDSITFLDLDLVPLSHFRDIENVQDVLQQVCARNAHERCRRFQSAPLTLTFQEAHRHAENRSEDLAQTRPEFGNASNASCFVGRRERVRDLYMDRRCFMHSYNPLSDTAESMILARILSAVVPVCEGINLQYYFSRVDSPGWGCGTKLPHNVVSLLGVMDGHASDLRAGLPWQGVEIHEALRLLLIIETTPESILGIMAANPTVNRIIGNGWIQLTLLDPHSNKLVMFRNGKFVPFEPTEHKLPIVPSSLDWYRGWRKHLGFAEIYANEPPSTPPANTAQASTAELGAESR
jgi:uncharacterized protein YbcC (UPF0753/DUF2309 family)